MCISCDRRRGTVRRQSGFFDGSARPVSSSKRSWVKKVLSGQIFFLLFNQVWLHSLKQKSFCDEFLGGLFLFASAQRTAQSWLE